MALASTDDVVRSSALTTPSTDQQRPNIELSSSHTYPYLELLHRLQEVSSTRKDIDDDINEDEAPVVAAELKNLTQQNDEWDLCSDALLASLLNELSSHIQSRTHQVSSKIRTLQSSVNQVGVEVALVQQQWMKKSRDISMEQVVGEDDDENDSASLEERGVSQHNLHEGDNGDDDDSSADIARLEAEEEAAIQNGMKALSLFFDPELKKSPLDNHDVEDTSGENNHDNNAVISSEEDNMIGDNCYFYPAADTDRFNQRPLPFIVGSREFMESCCCSEGED